MIGFTLSPLSFCGTLAASLSQPVHGNLVTKFLSFLGYWLVHGRAYLLLFLIQLALLFYKYHVNNATLKNNAMLLGQAFAAFVCFDLVASTFITYRPRKNKRKKLYLFLNGFSMLDFRRGSHVFCMNYFLASSVWLYLILAFPLRLMTTLIWRPVMMLEDKIANIFGISLVSLTLYRAAPSMEMGLWLLNWLVSILVVSVSTISFRPLYNQHIFFLIKEIYNDVDAFIDYPRTIEPTISEVLAILPATFRDYIKPFGLAIFSYYLVVSFLHSPYSLYIAMVISLMLLFKRFLVQQACDTWNSYYVPDSSLLQITSKCTNLFTSLQTSTSWDYLLSEAYTPARYFLLYVLTMAWFIRMEKVSVFAYHVIFVPLIIVIFVLNRILTIYQVMYVALIKQFGPTIQFEGLFVWPFVYHGKSKSMLHCLYEDIFHVEAFVYQNVPLPNELKRRVLVYSATSRIKAPLEKFLSKVNHLLDLIAGRVSKHTGILIYKIWNILVYYGLMPCIILSVANFLQHLEIYA